MQVFLPFFVRASGECLILFSLWLSAELCVSFLGDEFFQIMAYVLQDFKVLTQVCPIKLSLMVSVSSEDWELK